MYEQFNLEVSLGKGHKTDEEKGRLIATKAEAKGLEEQLNSSMHTGLLLSPRLVPSTHKGQLTTVY